VVGHQIRVGSRASVRGAHSINAAAKLNDPTRFNPPVQLPPHSVDGFWSCQKKSRGKNGHVTGNSQKLFPFHGIKMTCLTINCNIFVLIRRDEREFLMALKIIRKTQNLKNQDFGLLIKLQEIQRITNLFVDKVG
jgi:hypothetical protein